MHTFLLTTLLLITLTLATIEFPTAQQASSSDARIHVRPAQVISHLSPWMYGSCIEDVNHEIYGGLYAQRIFGESFEEPPVHGGIGAVSGMWDPVVTGSAQAHFVWDSEQAYNTAHSQQIAYLGGSGTVGIANRGLNRWGIAVREGQALQGHLYLRGLSAAPPVIVALQSADGTRTYAQQSLAPADSEWTRRDFRLRPTATDPNARFALWLAQPGSVGVDQVYLSDTGKALFRGHPFRADIGNKLVEQGLTFLRYGGSMINAPEYRCKKMLGPRDLRPQYRGTWYPYSTNGFGIEEFVQFCEAAHIEPAFAINIDETPEDAADLVEYLNGPTTSGWGAKRAANGHPKPYDVRYIEIGNEEGIDGSQAWYRRYLERFELLYAAMRPRDPNVHYVIAAWWNPDEPYCKQIAQALNGKAALWDVHVGGDNLREAEKVDRTLTQMQRLFAGWIPDSDLRACIFEENGDRHDLQRALGHARILNVTQRHGDFVRMDCPANCLQPLGQNDNGWNQGQLFFLPDRTWGMPPYYAQQMAAHNHLPLCVGCDTDSPNGDLDVTATRSENGKTLVLKVVNSGDRPHRADIWLEEFLPAAHADVWTLSGDLNAVNTPDTPERIRPAHTVLDIPDIPGATFAYTFPPYSYTVLRISTEGISSVARRANLPLSTSLP